MRSSYDAVSWDGNIKLKGGDADRKCAPEGSQGISGAGLRASLCPCRSNAQLLVDAAAVVRRNQLAKHFFDKKRFKLMNILHVKLSKI